MKAPIVLGSLLALAGTAATAERADAAISDIDVREELKEAVCFQDWYKAIELSSSLITSAEIAPDERQALLSQRRQFYTYVKGNFKVDGPSDCQDLIASSSQLGTVTHESSIPRFSSSAAYSGVAKATPSSPLNTLANLWTVGVRIEGNNIKGTVLNNGLTTANNVTLIIRSQQEDQTENVRTVAIDTVQAWGEANFTAAFNDAPGSWTIERIEVN